MFSMLRIALIALASCAWIGAAQAAPITYTGQAQIVSVSSALGLLPTYLGSTPSVGDVVTFTLTYDAATLGPQQLIQPPETVLYPGGITSFSMTLNGVTLAEPDTRQPGESSLIVTTSATPVLGIPGFVDGYSITAGTTNDVNGNHWGANFFFFDGNLASLAAPTTIPDPAQFQIAGIGYRSFNAQGQFDSFGAYPLTIAVVPEPATAALLAGGAIAVLATRRKRAR
jgi:hypothetical protein